MSDIRNPQAYFAAKEARIKNNANTTRRRKLEAAVAGDSEEFRAWLLGGLPSDLDAMREEAQAQFDKDCDDNSPTQLAYHAANEAWRKRVGYLPSFLNEAMNNWGGLTDGQLAFARKKFAELTERAAGRDAEEEARKANAAPWVEGRQEIEGVVLTIKSVEGNGPSWQNRSSLKGLIKLADGRLLWTSMPYVIFSDAEGHHVEIKGTTVRMNVTVTPKAEDKTFGFGKRPSKAVVLNVAKTEEK